MELAIQKYLRTHGLEKTVADFNLVAREYPHKVLIRYNQIESNFTFEEVRDARGIVLERDTWNVMSLAFRKFFNLGEGHAAPMDWASTRFMKKLDGSMIQAYFDHVKNEWCFGTTGTGEGEGDVDNFHYDKLGRTFAELFAYAFKETFDRKKSHMEGPPELKTPVTESIANLFDRWRGSTLAFELCTPYNIVVTPHQQSTVYLLAARRNDTLEEYSQIELKRIADYIGVDVAPSVQLDQNSESMFRSFTGMPYYEEGYVAVDKDNNRVKCKNPAYVAVHFIKDETAFWRVIDIIRSGELDEFMATFPHRKEELEKLDIAWKKLQGSMQSLKDELLSSEEYKAYVGTDAYKKYLVALANWKVVKSTLTAEEIKLVKTAGRGHDEYIAFTSTLKENGGLPRKNIAMKIQDLCMNRNLKRFSAYYFSWLNEPEELISDYLRGYDGKDLYEILTSKAWQ